MLLRAPAAGQISLVVPEVGEAVVPGETVLTLVPDGGVWFGFNVREDALGGLAISAQVPVAAQGGTASGHVAEMRNWGEFATWRAARASGDHDLNTFFLRVEPAEPLISLAPGQTVWLQHSSPTYRSGPHCLEPPVACAGQNAPYCLFKLQDNEGRIYNRGRYRGGCQALHLALLIWPSVPTCSLQSRTRRAGARGPAALLD
ncbi:MAG: HlyD family efflux transporter periplasmic adaptor subunit [Rhodopila sp.]